MKKGRIIINSKQRISSTKGNCEKSNLIKRNVTNNGNNRISEVWKKGASSIWKMEIIRISRKAVLGNVIRKATIKMTTKPIKRESNVEKGPAMES